MVSKGRKMRHVWFFCCLLLRWWLPPCALLLAVSPAWGRFVDLQGAVLAIDTEQGVTFDQPLDAVMSGSLLTSRTYGRFNTTALKEQFPGYFRNVVEQESFQRVSEEFSLRVKEARENVDRVSQRYRTCYARKTCLETNGNDVNDNEDLQSSPPLVKEHFLTTSCSLDSAAPWEVSLHACCVSKSVIIKPDYLAAGDGTQVLYQIAQFPQHNLSQYFQSEICCQAASCFICTCTQTFTLTTAVILDPPNSGLQNLKVKLVRIPGCCKCFNVF